MSRAGAPKWAEEEDNVIRDLVTDKTDPKVFFEQFRQKLPGTLRTPGAIEARVRTRAKELHVSREYMTNLARARARVRVYKDTLRVDILGAVRILRCSDAWVYKLTKRGVLKSKINPENGRTEWDKAALVAYTKENPVSQRGRVIGSKKSGDSGDSGQWLPLAEIAKRVKISKNWLPNGKPNKIRRKTSDTGYLYNVDDAVAYAHEHEIELKNLHAAETSLAHVSRVVPRSVMDNLVTKLKCVFDGFAVGLYESESEVLHLIRRIVYTGENP